MASPRPGPGQQIDWAAVDRALPTAATPEGQAKRRELFDHMDPNHNGSLTLTEATAGLPEPIRPLFPNRDYRAAVKCAFAVARDAQAVQGSKKVVTEANRNVDRQEFHALLIAFRQYLELDCVFDSIDTDGDRRLSLKDCNGALDKLKTWKVARAEVKNKFKALGSTDEWAPLLKYDDFAEWCIRNRFGNLNLRLDENDPLETLKADAGGGSDVGLLLKAFQRWDDDGNGWISEEELVTVLTKLDPQFTAEMARTLFEVADLNKDGKIDYTEFSKWIGETKEDGT
jgi:hypothetical protein